MTKYKRIYISFDPERHARAIKILDDIPPYWRSHFVADAIVSHFETRNSASKLIEPSAPDAQLTSSHLS
jgi:hypothetical protein